ncbi:MAG: thioredoxin family protein [Planctomycetes bacterium]|nr:thioredoxin family protein [Planctomycetota bacterium]
MWNRTVVSTTGSPSALPIALASGAIFAGCEMRDEEVRSGPPPAWPATVARRLSDDISTTRSRPQSGSGPEWVDGFAAGSRRAAEAGLPMLLVFRAGWCRWSGDLVGTAAADGRMVATTGRLVCVSIDADREATICRSFGVHAFPTLVALDVEGRERFRATGAAARHGLATALAAAIGTPRPRVATGPAGSPR